MDISKIIKDCIENDGGDRIKKDVGDLCPYGNVKCPYLTYARVVKLPSNYILYGCNYIIGVRTTRDDEFE